MASIAPHRTIAIRITASRDTVAASELTFLAVSTGRAIGYRFAGFRPAIAVLASRAVAIRIKTTASVGFPTTSAVGIRGAAVSANGKARIGISGAGTHTRPSVADLTGTAITITIASLRAAITRANMTTTAVSVTRTLLTRTVHTVRRGSATIAVIIRTGS